MPLVVLRHKDILGYTVVKYTASVLFVIFCLFIERLVSKNVQQPYIDEIFHLNQCQKYCDYRFKEWDNKITTPPGLYLIGFAYARLVNLLSGGNGEDSCMNYEVLRSVNLIGGLVVLPLIIHNFKGRNRSWTVNIVSQPLVFPYYFLFYTDIWSTILVILAFTLAIRQPFGPLWSNYVSGIVGFASLALRQTNIIWIAFIAAAVVAERSERSSNLFDTIWNTIQSTLQHWASLVPYVLNIVLFAAFIKVNGGITFGDKENHTINFHAVQVFYCFTFINIFTLPTYFSLKRVGEYFRFCLDRKIFNIGLMVLIKCIIDRYTVVHPFLLADNRHYTFYIYRRALRYGFSQFATVPLYHFSAWNIAKSFKSAKVQPVVVIAYFVAVCLVLIPSPLFEPRYYIAPLIVYKLLARNSSGLKNSLEFIWLNTINVIMMYIFFKYEFEWQSDPNVIQRIIW